MNIRDIFVMGALTLVLGMVVLTAIVIWQGNIASDMCAEQGYELRMFSGVFADESNVVCDLNKPINTRTIQELRGGKIR